MSDEFNVDNRSFKDGHDPLWTALDRSDDDANSAGGGSLHFYNSSAVTTKNGMLKINTYVDKTEWMHFDKLKKEWKHMQTNFTSGMMQSWNKFCFTGGIVEFDIIFPGEPHLGGLWPAVWMMGNLGRAAYEPSTNNIWPWSYDKCDRKKQQAQTISACDRSVHYGMHPFQGRGATEIDLVEVMTGNSDGPLPGTKPNVSLPYADMTLQVAPGIPLNRPQSGSRPIRKKSFTASGYTEYAGQTWYDDLVLHGNTSINPFFYGTYLDKTKPGEPVSRTEKQAFQADAVGAVHQLTPAHFRTPHTFRLEWQPGPGGRLDWFVSGGYKVNGTMSEVDGKGTEWIQAFSIKDKSLSELMGSQIPIEPSYLIMNTAISSTWGFPYDTPSTCAKCFDCNDPKCACNFDPGYCQMLKEGVTMYIDSVRIYQSPNDAAHVGAPHTLGCDPPDYPTKDWIEGHSDRYMRTPPFSLEDTGPLHRIQRGGGQCLNDNDCGGNVQSTNFTELYEMKVSGLSGPSSVSSRGECLSELPNAMLSFWSKVDGVCSCFAGFTGPHCLALDHWDNYPSAQKVNSPASPFGKVTSFQLPIFLLVVIGSLVIMVLGVVVDKVTREKRASSRGYSNPEYQPLTHQVGTPGSLVGISV
jgi:beta-glucanase (GH16 family)